LEEHATDVRSIVDSLGVRSGLSYISAASVAATTDASSMISPATSSTATSKVVDTGGANTASTTSQVDSSLDIAAAATSAAALAAAAAESAAAVAAAAAAAAAAAEETAAMERSLDALYWEPLLSAGGRGEWRLVADEAYQVAVADARLWRDDGWRRADRVTRTALPEVSYIFPSSPSPLLSFSPRTAKENLSVHFFFFSFES